MENPVGALRASVDRLHALVGGLDDAQLVSRSYCDDWSIAQVLSHLGSGAVISLRGLQDVRAGTPTPDDFNQSVWDEWNAKSPRAQADDALAADEALTRALEAMTETERAGLTFSLGPMNLGFNDMFGLRLNEHAFHTWDIAVVFDGSAACPRKPPQWWSTTSRSWPVSAAVLMARTAPSPSAQPTPSAPSRCGSRPTVWRWVPASPGSHPTCELPAEALSRLVYGRLDSGHTPVFTGDAALVETLRGVFPGP